MTMTAEAARKYILELVDWELTSGYVWELTNGYVTEDLITEWGNVNAEVDCDGDVWVWIGDDKGRGHWLEDIKLVEFVEWHKESVK